jgi:hypothetical protein
MQDDAEHWRRRAQESRVLAEQHDEPDEKKTLREIAEAYEQLAVVGRAAWTPSSRSDVSARSRCAGFRYRTFDTSVLQFWLGAEPWRSLQ